MDRMTRRAALAALSAGGFGALASGADGAASGERDARSELFAVGPFSPGDWYRKNRKHAGATAKDLVVQGAAPDADIVRSLNECELYVIDRRLWKDKDRAVFEDSDRWEPRLVASGKLIHAWKEKGKDCTIWLGSLTLALDSTSNGAAPPRRKASAHVELIIRGDNGLVAETATYGFSSPLVYDATGRRPADDK